MKNKYLILQVFIIIFALSAQANDAKEYPENFMQSLIAGKYNKAIDDYFGSNPLFANKQQQITLLKTRIPSIFTLFGKSTGYELSIQEELSPSLYRFVYLLKHKNHPSTWEFFVYRVDENNWIADTMNFSDNFNSLHRYK